MKKTSKITEKQHQYLLETNSTLDKEALSTMRKDNPDRYQRHRLAAIRATGTDEEVRVAEYDQRKLKLINKLPDLALQFDIDTQEEWVNEDEWVDNDGCNGIEIVDIITHLVTNKKEFYDVKAKADLLHNLEMRHTYDGECVVEGSSRYIALVSNAQAVLMDKQSKKKKRNKAEAMLKTLRVEPEVDHYANAEEKEYIVGDMFPMYAIGEVFGPFENLKTAVLIDLLFCVAHGIDFRGYKVKQGQILYVAGEDMKGVKLRLRALAKYYGTPNNENMFRLIDGKPYDLVSPEGMDKFLTKVKSYGQSQMMVLDTLRKVAGQNFDITLNTGWGMLEQNMSKLIDTHVKNITWVTHPTKSKPKEMAGGDERISDIDFAYRFERKDEDILTTTMIHKKNKGAGKLPTRDFHFKVDHELKTIIPAETVERDVPQDHERDKLEGNNLEVYKLIESGDTFADAVATVFNSKGSMTSKTIKNKRYLVRKAFKEASITQVTYK